MAAPAQQRSIEVGSVRLTYLPDGHATYVPNQMFAESNDAVWKLHPQWLNTQGRFVLSIGGLLLQTSSQTILIDIGLGDKHADVPGLVTRVGGELLQNLRRAEIEPEDIDLVLYTHLHHDHVGWTSVASPQGRALTFPNARHVVRQLEWEYWRGTDTLPGPSLVEVQQPLENRIELVEEGHVAAPGLNLVATPGHTPGHCSVVVSSGDQRAIILGDAIHCPVQLDEPTWNCVFDVDPGLGRRTRERLWAELEDPSTVTAGGHFADFTFGRVIRAEGKPQWRGGV